MAGRYYSTDEYVEKYKIIFLGRRSERAGCLPGVVIAGSSRSFLS